LEPLRTEATPGGQQLLTRRIQPIHLGAAAGQHDHVLDRVAFGVLPGRPPVVQQGQGGGRLGVGGGHPVVGPVGGYRLVDQADADQLQGFAFPGLLLPAVLGQLAGPQPQAEGAEPATGIDRRQLPVIAH
jgi:hypothetical protein